jgi:peptidoglycan-associated lipoprotein
MMKQWFTVLCLTILMMGCGTTVPLNNVPVETAKPTPVANNPTGGDSSVSNNTALSPVDLGQNQLGTEPSEFSRIVYFDFDSYVIKPEFETVMVANAQFAKNNPSRKMMLEGHTDEIGGREYNLALGQKRAEAVRDALSILGVSQNQMEAVSFGKEKPAVAGFGEASYSQNRRVELRYP